MAVHRFTRGNLQFILGLILGITLSFMLTSYQTMKTQTRLAHNPVGNLMWRHEWEPYAHLDQHDDHVDAHGDVYSAHDDMRAKAVKFEDLHVHHDEDKVARELAGRVRILVWVMTGPQNLDKKAVHVKNTWGKRVNKLLFMSSEWNATFPTVGLNVSEGREHLTAKTMQAFRYVYTHHYDDADWFMKADDDTFVIAENLRYMLSAHSSKDPVYFGQVFKTIVKQGYASGGAGYILSKEALKRLATRGFNSTLCRQDGGAEDAEMGKCLMKLGVRILPSLDRLGRSRFHCFGPEAHLQGLYPKWYLHYDAYGAKKGMDNISDYPITFHYINPGRMYALEYFTYHLRPFGIISKDQDLNLNFTYKSLISERH